VGGMLLFISFSHRAFGEGIRGITSMILFSSQERRVDFKPANGPNIAFFMTTTL